jgi:hypothetical protein
MFDRLAYLAPLALTLFSAGCSVFDESLIPEPVDNQLHTTEALDCQVRASGSVDAERVLDLSELSDDVPSLPDCLSTAPARGKDFFFKVTMQRAERWHFHVVDTPGLDPAVYVLQNCNDLLRDCRLRSSGSPDVDYVDWGVNACPAGRPEHFTFRAPAAGDYFVGVDFVGDVDPGVDAQVKLVAVRAECHNGRPEHPEHCDDDNDPTCVECRRALTTGKNDDGKNDGPLDATVLLPEVPGTFTVSGSLASPCDFDFFQFEIAEQVVFNAQLTAAGDGEACRAADLQLTVPGENPFALGPDPTGECATIPSLEDMPPTLDPGTHILRVATHPDLHEMGKEHRYTLTLDLQPAP